jgi:hypothetical protein
MTLSESSSTDGDHHRYPESQAAAARQPQHAAVATRSGVVIAAKHGRAATALDLGYGHVDRSHTLPDVGEQERGDDVVLLVANGNRVDGGSEAVRAAGELTLDGEDDADIGCGVRSASDGNRSSQSSSFYSTVQRTPITSSRASSHSGSSSTYGPSFNPALSPPPTNAGGSPGIGSISKGHNADASIVGGAVHKQDSDAPVSLNHSDAPAIEDAQSSILSPEDCGSPHVPLDPTPPSRVSGGAAARASDEHPPGPQGTATFRSKDAAGGINRPSSNGVRRSLGAPSPSFRKQSVV